MNSAIRDGQDWQPVAGVEMARSRANMLDCARDFFDARNVLLVDTPAMGLAAVSDPNVESVTATVDSGTQRDFFLQTSPEYSMKRLLAAGFPDIAQICKVFRDGESGQRHQPEFTMAEWYRLGFDLQAIIDDTEQFLLDLIPAANTRAPIRLSYRDCFLRYTGLDPLVASTNELKRSDWADDALRDALGNDRDAWLDLLMVNAVAPNFAAGRLTTVHHFPASQAALARLDASQPEVAERFEIYLGDLELANGYVELTDAEELEARFANDQSARQRREQSIRPLDIQFIAAMQAGLPDCAGVAVGLDRVLMSIAGEADIRRVQHFPTRPSA